MIECQTCGVLNPDDAKECINCGDYLVPVTDSTPVVGPPADQTAPSQTTPVPPEPAEESTPSSDPWQAPVADSAGFILNSAFDGSAHEFDGQDIMVNRGVLAPGNMSLSSKRHARIFQKDGQWFLQDLSSNQATFVQVREPVPLEDGTSIILGQKVFTFQRK